MRKSKKIELNYEETERVISMAQEEKKPFEVLKEAGTLEYVSGAKCPIGSNCILIYRPDESSSTKLPTKPVPVRSNEKHSEQIAYFNKQIEELNISIQQYDDEIFRLSGLSSKAKSEREKLIKIVDLLKS